MPAFESLLTAGLTVFLFAAVLAGLVLVVLSLVRPRTLPLVVTAALIVLGLVLVIVLPVRIPLLAGALLAVPAVALAILGGNPVTRRILELAVRGRVTETADGGIVVGDDRDDRGPVLLRGGTTIGYLERTGVALAVVAGYPEAIAIVVAIKGIGRFPELAAAEARERFIIGTLGSLLWACVVAGLVRLAIS